MDSGQARRSVFGEGGDRRWLIASSCVALLVLAPLVSLILIAVVALMWVVPDRRFGEVKGTGG